MDTDTLPVHEVPFDRDYYTRSIEMALRSIARFSIIHRMRHGTTLSDKHSRDTLGAVGASLRMLPGPAYRSVSRAFVSASETHAAGDRMGAGDLRGAVEAWAYACVAVTDAVTRTLPPTHDGRRIDGRRMQVELPAAMVDGFCAAAVAMLHGDGFVCPARKALYRAVADARSVRGPIHRSIAHAIVRKAIDAFDNLSAAHTGRHIGIPNA